mgnify:CR=1 FL=1
MLDPRLSKSKIHCLMFVKFLLHKFRSNFCLISSHTASAKGQNKNNMLDHIVSVAKDASIHHYNMSSSELVTPR